MMLKLKKIFLFLLLLCVLTPGIVSAHQPRIVEGPQTIVTDPEVSKAYYGRLTGVPNIFTIQAVTPFSLYVNILVPDIANQKKDVSATVFKDGKLLTILDGTQFTWKQMFEPFGHDNYWTGPEYKSQVDSGTYVITVTSSNNDSKYSLAVGEIENFNFKEIVNTLKLVPELKRSFFNGSPIDFILSPFGWGIIIILYVLSGIFGLIYRFVLRKISKGSTRGVSKNINTSDRLIRLAIGIALLLWAITTTWSLILIFFSGFAMFEAIFSWCGLYAALGKSTCPAE